MSHAGLLYNGVDADPEDVRWRVEGGDLVIASAAGEERLPLTGLRASTRVGSTRRAVFLPDHRQLQTDDNAAVDAAFGRRGLEALTDRLERHVGAAVTSVLVTVLLVGGVTVYGLPWAAARVARAMPPSVEAPLGEQVLGLLDGTILEPTTLDAATRAHYTAVFDAFQARVPGGGAYRVAFRQMDDVPNAFALPGGTIIFTDGLLELVEEDEDFLAVAAHEIGHQQERHTLRAVLQQSALVVALAVLSGDVSGISGVVVGVPTFLLDNHYSRAFESEADERAFEYLRAQGISPAWFARIMARMESAGEADDEATDAAESEGSATWASTHPPTAARQRRALELGRDLPAPGRLIADRGAERLSAGGAAALEPLDAAVLAEGCWSGSWEEDDDVTARWWQRYRPDGTLRLVIERTSADEGDPVRVSEFAGFWAVRGGALSEHAQYVASDAAAPWPAGSTSRYLARFADRADRMVLRSPDESEDIEALAVSCPEGLQ